LCDAGAQVGVAIIAVVFERHGCGLVLFKVMGRTVDRGPASGCRLSVVVDSVKEDDGAEKREMQSLE
jgi:hypothetical protein